LHLIRIYGALPPSFTNEAKLRALVVPDSPEEVTGESDFAARQRDLLPFQHPIRFVSCR